MRTILQAVIASTISFCVHGVQRVVAVTLQTTTTMTIGAPRTLFTVTATMGINSFDVTRDGERFLLSVSDEASSRPSIVVTTNWLARVQARR